MTFQDFLVQEGACSEAREWAWDLSFEDAWNTCTVHDWMLWLLGKLKMGPACTCNSFSPSSDCAVVQWEKKFDTPDKLRAEYPFAVVHARFLEVTTDASATGN